MRRMLRTCEIPTLTGCCARARRAAPATFSQRACRSGRWLDRQRHHPLGFVQWLSNNRSFGLRWPSGIHLAEFGRGSPARAFLGPLVLRRHRGEVGARRWPRPGNDSERMLIALGTSGDIRFGSRRTQPAA